MLFESDKIMFEIYRETEYTGRYRVVYFTELQEHNKESEINRALRESTCTTASSRTPGRTTPRGSSSPF